MLGQLLTWILAIIVTFCTAVMPFEQALANPVQTENVQVQLVSEVENIQPSTPFWVGLHFKIRSGWHIYWRNPGDSGLKPTIDWTLPAGFKAGEIVWPHPERLPVGPLINFGYENEVNLLTKITPDANLKIPSSVQLRASADWIVCKVDCIPEEATLNLTLPATSNPPEVNQHWAAAFDQTRQAVPKPSPWTVTATVKGEELLLRVNAPQMQKTQIERVAFFPDSDGIITNAAPQKAVFNSDGLTLQLQRGELSKLDQVSGVLVIQEALENQTAAQSFIIQAKVTSDAATANTTSTSEMPIPKVLLLALLGGVTLNLMPCVFPVLSLKALNIVQKAQKSPTQVRLQALAFTAGVGVSFTVVAGVLLVLRALGQQIGWGFQLQSPVFVTLMAYLMFAVGLSLSGVFVFGASLMGIGQGLADREGYAGEFFSGVFATLVATPCTAPFMATAIGVALTQSAFVAIAIFEILGLGMTLPYLVISFTPSLQRLLPKPGAWMETFQQLLAFPMFAATAWLVWVLTQQAGTTGLAAALVGLILISFAAWLHQKTRMVPRFWQRLGSIGALIVLGVALTLPQLGASSFTSIPQNQSQGLDWEVYTAERLASLRQSGTPVFVNFSAAWCITCLVNERVALNQPDTIAAFESKGVARLKGDWTNRNRAITEALESFGRSGVPLYVFYPTGSESEPIILPQLLSSAQVQKAIDTL